MPTQSTAEERLDRVDERYEPAGFAMFAHVGWPSLAIMGRQVAD